MYVDSFFPSYEITPLTLAVVAYWDPKREKFTSKIMEEQSETFVDLTPTKVIDQACKFFGDSLEGKRAGTKEVCGITHKAPICIDPPSGMYFFPTSSPSNPDCSWIAHSHISHVQQGENQLAEIVFFNGRRLTLETSVGSIINQKHRTAQFRFLLSNRFIHLHSYQTQKYPDDYIAESLLKVRK